jgi:hypothetical protein
MKPASPFQETEDGSSLRLEWDNRQVRKDGCTFFFLLVFWIIWAPATVFVTGLLLVDDGGGRWFFAIWLVFGWLGTLGIPYTFLGRSWREWIEISAHTVCHGHEGFLAPRRKSFPLDTILCIFFGHVGDETPVTLSVFRVPGRLGLRNQHLFGYWLAPELKKQMFDRIEAFVRDKELSLRMHKGYHSG